MAQKNIKEQIIDTASQLFANQGFQQTTMDAIAEKICKAKGLLYYYFKSKEDLFREVLMKELEGVKNKLNIEKLPGDDSLEVLRNYFLTRMKILNKASNYKETLKADFRSKYEFVKDVRENFVEFEKEQLLLILKKGQQEGFLHFTNTQSVVDVLLMVMTSVEIPLYLHQKYPSLEPSLNELIDILTNSLRSYSK